MNRLVYLIVAVYLFLTPTVVAEPVNLYTAYLKALEYDAKLKVAEAGHNAKKEEIAKARANLLPTLRASVTQGRNATESTTLSASPTEYWYNTKRYSITAKQPLLNMESIAAYGQAKAQVKKSEVLLLKEQKDLLLRTADVYFNMLYAQDQLSFSVVHLDALKEQLEQAKKRYRAGYGTITEISEVQAEYDMALADHLESENSIEILRHKLENITGVYPAIPYVLDPDKMHLKIPEPHSVDEWIALAQENNYDLDALHHDITIAAKEIAKQRYMSLPTVDLVASKSYSESGNDYSIGSKYDTYSLNVQLNLPLYTGGYTSAAVRQAKSNRIAAYEQLNFQEREISTVVREYYRITEQSIAKIRAYQQAVKSSEIALTGTKKGYTAGLRSNVDVLNAIDALYFSSRNLAKSRYDYILSRIFLKQAAGVLSEDELVEISSWLVKQ